jgi:hypothetical protein
MAPDDFSASVFGRTYSAYMERPWLSRAISRFVWGGDSGPYYESMAAIGEVVAGGLIVDCPCGAGPALRTLDPETQVRYLAADLSPSMLRAAPGGGRRSMAGGSLVGATFLKGEDSRRQKALIRANSGDFGRVAAEGEILAWLAAAGFELGRTERPGPMLFFAATTT